MLYEKKALLNELLAEREKGALLRMRMVHLQQLMTPSRLFFKLETSSKNHKQILSLRSADGRILTDPSDIKLTVKNFFSHLYSSKPTSLGHTHSFTDPLPTLTEAQNLTVEGEIT